MPTASKTPQPKRVRPDRQQEIHIRISDTLALGVRELAAARRVPITAIYKAAIAAYLSPSAQDRRDAMLAWQWNRFSCRVESVEWNAKLLAAVMRYQIELDLSFLPEPVTDDAQARHEGKVPAGSIASSSG